jgi:hypothetical protein
MNVGKRRYMPNPHLEPDGEQGLAAAPAGSQDASLQVGRLKLWMCVCVQQSSWGLMQKLVLMHTLVWSASMGYVIYAC